MAAPPIWSWRPGTSCSSRKSPALKPGAMLTRIRTGVMPDITLVGDGEDWRPQRDLLATDRFTPDFVVEMEDDGVATVRFGDGVLGRSPAAGSIFSAQYRVGNGLAGNVGAEALGRIVTRETAITGLRNPLPATGGREAQPTEKVRLYAPQAFRTQ